MKKTYLFTILLISVLLFNACTTDEFVNTQIGVEYLTYTGKTNEIDTIYFKFSNGKNNHYKVINILNDTSISTIISSTNNYVIIKYKSLGSTILNIRYYAKASLVSEVNVDIVCNYYGGGGTGTVGSTSTSKIFFIDKSTNYCYFINNDGTSKKRIGSLVTNNAILSLDGQYIYYRDGGYTNTYTIATNYFNKYQNYNSYVTKMNVTSDGYIVLKEQDIYGKYFTSLSSGYSTFYPRYSSPYSNNYTSLNDGFYINSIADNIHLSNIYDYTNNLYVLSYFKNGYNGTTIFSISGLLKGYKISPDGRYIGINYQNGGYYKLYIYDTVTSKKYVVTDFGYNEISDFQFSKDGKEIVFSGETTTGYFDLYTISSDGASTLKNITNTPYIDEVNPDWK